MKTPVCSPWVVIGLVIFLTATKIPAAGTVTVASEGNLRAALSGGGLVTFAVDGDITLGNTLVITNDTSIDGTGHAVILNGANTVRVLQVASNVSVTLANLTIANGLSSNGGGVYNDGVLNVSNCLFTNNVSAGGAGTNGPAGASGGTGSGGGSPGANAGDGSGAAGGAIYNVGTLNLTNSTVSGNVAQGGNGGAGGAGGDQGTHAALSSGGDGGAGGSGGGGSGAGIYNLGVARLESSSIISNVTVGGMGGPGGNGGFGGNTYGNGGNGGAGGDVSGAAIHSEGQLRINNSTVAGNQNIAGSGGAGGSTDAPQGTGGRGGNAFGGIWSAGTCGVTNTTITLNQCTGGSGALPGMPHPANVWCGAPGDGGSAGGGGFANAGTAVLANCTIWQNGALWGSTSNWPSCAAQYPGTIGGFYGVAVYNQTGAVFMVNSVIGGSPFGECAGLITDNGHNFCMDNSAHFSAPGSSNSVYLSLGPLQDNGGPTMTLALLPGSPLIDAGLAIGLTRDQRGAVRPYGIAPDVGAFEFSVSTFSLSPPVFSNTVWQVRVTGPTGAVVRLQGSSNLSSWVDMATGAMGSAGSAVLPASPTNGARGFYRTVSP